jgi:hypothetical protein
MGKFSLVISHPNINNGKPMTMDNFKLEFFKRHWYIKEFYGKYKNVPVEISFNILRPNKVFINGNKYYLRLKGIIEYILLFLFTKDRRDKKKEDFNAKRKMF